MVRMTMTEEGGRWECAGMELRQLEELERAKVKRIPFS